MSGAAFGEWRAQAEVVDFGRGVGLHIGREVSPQEWHILTSLDTLGGTAKTVTTNEGESFLKEGRIFIPLGAGEAIYQALHRLYGHSNPDGEIEALKDSLGVERSRVNAMLQAFLTPQATPAHHRPDHQVG